MPACRASERKRFLSRTSQQHTAGYKVQESRNGSSHTKLPCKWMKMTEEQTQKPTEVAEDAFVKMQKWKKSIVPLFKIIT